MSKGVHPMNHALSEYVDLLRENGLDPICELSAETLSTEIKNLTFDSREVTPQTLFICKGVNFLPKYAIQALESGAVALIGEKRIEGAEPFILVNNVRHAMVLAAQMFFENAPAELTIAGITGTKGKSTTAHFLNSILNRWMEETSRPESAIISTILTYDGKERFESHLTTPEPIDVYRHCRNAADSGISHMVLEVSSQAFKYERVEGIRFKVGCFLNIGIDHISPVEHSDFEDYFSSKLKMFDVSDCVCVNSESDHFDRIIEYGTGKSRIVTFGPRPQDDIYCSDIRKENGHTLFHVRTPEYETDFSLSMPGIFNVSNALAAIAMSFVLGVPERCVVSALAVSHAPGRNEAFSSRDGDVIGIVNYAHNQLSYEATFRSAKIEYPGKKIVAVFGAAGGRAEMRRHDLPVTAEKYCDLILVTEDDPGNEPLQKISSEIAANITKCPYEIIDDRGEAIGRAILDRTLGPKVVIAMGKGDSSYMARGFDFVDYPSDLEFMQKYLKEYDEGVSLNG